MPLQLLHHLLRLQIPYIHRMILRTTHNPLASSDGEAAKAAEPIVGVTRVGFETFAGVVVPEADGVVEGACEDEFAVGRELDEGDGRVIVVDERLEALAGSSVPDAAICERECVRCDVMRRRTMRSVEWSGVMT